MSVRKLFNIAFSNKKAPYTKTSTIQLGMLSLPIDVMFMERRSVTLRIDSNNDTIIMKVPFQVSFEDSIGFANSKKDWILRKLDERNKRRDNYIPRKYCDDSTHLFLGDTFKLKLNITKSRANDNVIEDGILVLNVPSIEKTKVELLKWYVRSTKSNFPTIISPIIADFLIKYGKSPVSIEYKYVKTYWGVCTSNGAIRLNIELMRAPKSCIEYIMAHELCHLIHQNHSAHFYNLLTEFMPDWKERKALLVKTISSKD